MTRTLLIYFCVLFCWQAASSQQAFRVQFKESSKINIRGTTTINNFEFEQRGSDFENRELWLTTRRTNERRTEIAGHRFGLRIRNFSSDDLLAQKAFYAMMREQEHPRLFVILKEVVASKTTESVYRGLAKVELIITGKTGIYEIPVSSIFKNGNWNMKGQTRLTIRDFGITPPHALMGLLQVSEWIDISLDLDCHIEPASTELAGK